MVPKFARHTQTHQLTLERADRVLHMATSTRFDLSLSEACDANVAARTRRSRSVASSLHGAERVASTI